MPPSDISDLSSTILPKSDQLNAEQLLGGDLTITVTDVRIGAAEDQPIAIHYKGDDGRPFKPCKTVRKILIFAWGEDGRKWVGRSMTLFNDPTVRFGGMTVGGIRVSHMSHIERNIEIYLTATKGKKAAHTIQVLKDVAAVTLAEVMSSIRGASNKATMDAAKRLVMQLTQASDIEQAKKAYADRVAELKASVARSQVQTEFDPAPMVAQMNATTDIDALGLIADGIQDVPEQYREQLGAAYRARLDELQG